MNEKEIVKWLREDDPDRLSELFRKADAVRREHVGDAVHLRGLVELSNICRRNCLYCGVRAGHSTVERYRLTADEVMRGARLASEFGYGTLVMQAGEDFGLEGEFVADLIRRIKKEYALAVTLSLGERTEADWRLWRQAGADRYLIRFETCNKDLFRVIHPPVGKDDLGFEGRTGALRVLRVFKAARYSRSIQIIGKVFQSSKEPLAAVGSLALVYILVSALIIINVEPDSFENFFDAVYWATVSLTTMGYGDIYPVTTIGRFVTMLSSIFGIAIVALPSGIITAGYLSEIERENAEKKDKTKNEKTDNQE